MKKPRRGINCMTKKKMVINTKAVSVLLKKFILLRKIEGTLQG
jgi:hypothetical protein